MPEFCPNWFEDGITLEEINRELKNAKPIAKNSDPEKELDSIKNIFGNRMKKIHAKQRKNL